MKARTGLLRTQSKHQPSGRGHRQRAHLLGAGSQVWSRMALMETWAHSPLYPWVCVQIYVTVKI